MSANNLVPGRHCHVALTNRCDSGHRSIDVREREFVRTVLILLLSFLAELPGCGGKSPPDKLDSIPECRTFQDLYARCVGHGSVPEITPGGTVPTDPADRARLTKLCAINADRLKKDICR